MSTYNDIGIGKDLDWNRVRKLFLVGLCAGNHALFNALTAGWISIGNIWMFGGLLFMMEKAKER